MVTAGSPVTWLPSAPSTVTGIDQHLNTVKHLGYAERFAAKLAMQLGHKLPIRFAEMNATALDLPDACMDLVLADNVFEHFIQYKGGRRGPASVAAGWKTARADFLVDLLQVWIAPEARPQAALGQFGLLRRPIAAMQRLANDDPRLFAYYPDLPTTRSGRTCAAITI